MWMKEFLGYRIDSVVAAYVAKTIQHYVLKINAFTEEKICKTKK